MVDRVYSDASMLDGPDAPLARLGWAFVAVDHDNRTVGIARGVPPPWITCVSAAEGWALLMAAGAVGIGPLFVTDSLETVKGIDRGRQWATGAARPYARLWKLIYDIFDGEGDAASQNVVWMPAHKTSSRLGSLMRSDGALVTQNDLIGNDMADLHAKLAAAEHRAPQSVRDHLQTIENMIHRVATAIGLATYAANNCKGEVKRDSQLGVRPRQIDHDGSRRVRRRERQSVRTGLSNSAATTSAGSTANGDIVCAANSLSRGVSWHHSNVVDRLRPAGRKRPEPG